MREVTTYLPVEGDSVALCDSVGDMFTEHATLIQVESQLIALFEVVHRDAEAAFYYVTDGEGRGQMFTLTPPVAVVAATVPVTIAINGMTE